MKIIIPSCVGFDDAAAPGIQLLRRNWPACPHEVCLVTDHLGDRCKSVAHDNSRRSWDRIIEIGCDDGWCKNLLRGLDELEADRHDGLILMVMDDFWIERVDAAFINRVVEFMEYDDTARNVGNFRLYPSPSFTDPLSGWGGLVGTIRRGTPYRISCCQGIWRSSYLRALLTGLKTAWDFEIAGSAASSALAPEVISTSETHRPMICTYTAITRGEWEPKAVEWARSLGIEVDASARPMRWPNPKP